MEEWSADEAAAAEAEAEGRLPGGVPSAVRRTKFRMPLDVPAVVRKLAGGDSVEVRETQVLFLELVPGPGADAEADARETALRSDPRLARTLKAYRESAKRGEHHNGTAGGPGKDGGASFSQGPGRGGGASFSQGPERGGVASFSQEPGTGGGASASSFSASCSSSPLSSSSWSLSYVVRSSPAPQIPGSNRFRTSIETRLEDRPGGGASVRVEAACTASGPYGLTGIIEGAMADSSSKTIAKTLEASRRRVHEARDDPIDLRMAVDRTEDVFQVLWKQLEARAIAQAEAELREEQLAAERGAEEGRAGAAMGARLGAPPGAPPREAGAEYAPGALPGGVPAARGAGAASLVAPSASPTSTTASEYLDASSGEFPPLPPPSGSAAADATALYARYSARTGDQQLEVLLAIQQSLARLEAAERRRERSRKRWRRWAELAAAAAAGAAAAALALRVADRRRQAA